MDWTKWISFPCQEKIMFQTKTVLYYQRCTTPQQSLSYLVETVCGSWMFNCIVSEMFFEAERSRASSWMLSTSSSHIVETGEDERSGASLNKSWLFSPWAVAVRRFSRPPLRSFAYLNQLVITLSISFSVAFRHTAFLRTAAARWTIRS